MTAVWTNTVLQLVARTGLYKVYARKGTGMKCNKGALIRDGSSIFQDTEHIVIANVVA